MLVQGIFVGTESCKSSYTDDPAAAQSVANTSCWFKGIVLLQQEVPVVKGDTIIVCSFADLQNFVCTSQTTKAAAATTAKAAIATRVSSPRGKKCLRHRDTHACTQRGREVETARERDRDRAAQMQRDRES